MEEKTFKGKCLYTTRGAAKEYGSIGCNFYRGCPLQCSYCYNRKGITAKMLGGDKAVLDDCFTKREHRPKKYRELTDETYAMQVFKREFMKNIDYFRQTGIFLSFSTDPMLDETHMLTYRAANFAVQHQVPVTILTKYAWTFTLLGDWFGMEHDFHQGCQKYISFGFTLTGRDDLEEVASKRFSSNAERLKVMKMLKEMGYKVWASIEPVVTLDDSMEMIESSISFCDHYKIGLMSGTTKGYYGSLDDLRSFVKRVTKLITRHPGVTVYWKRSIRNELQQLPDWQALLTHPQFIEGGMAFMMK